jgi:hypothetical protein
LPVTGLANERTATDVWIKIGNEAYVTKGVDGKLMPAYKNQPPPDLSYFEPSRK